MYGIVDSVFPLGLAICLISRGKAAFDIAVTHISPLHLPPNQNHHNQPLHPRPIPLSSPAPPTAILPTDLPIRPHPRIFPLAAHTDIIPLFDTHTLRVVATRIGTTPYLALRYNTNITSSFPYHETGFWSPLHDPDFSTRHEDLPLAVRHAIALTTKLGYRYIYLDSVCGNFCAGDVTDKIYPGAEYIIMAAAGRDAVDAGIQGVYQNSVREVRLKGERVREWELRPCFGNGISPPPMAREKMQKCGLWELGVLGMPRLVTKDVEEWVGEVEMRWGWGMLVLDQGLVGEGMRLGDERGREVVAVKIGASERGRRVQVPRKGGCLGGLAAVGRCLGTLVALKGSVNRGWWEKQGEAEEEERKPLLRCD
ncbi:hypothetical protein QBC34DRAFT_384544 [Podospora aff. communis PSN243]|uniref:Heterokaryon incompatibility domain-containing protein n=1 Tax=Podospora aff. communis PSN243 TaxID=3040156 RepID=A0AAV9GAH5_9PEZI|nr:hypothetical protein QBC34DRAFT_384544 [Podospora aff. communis PSN243]